MNFFTFYNGNETTNSNSNYASFYDIPELSFTQLTELNTLDAHQYPLYSPASSSGSITFDGNAFPIQAPLYENLGLDLDRTNNISDIPITPSPGKNYIFLKEPFNTNYNYQQRVNSYPTLDNQIKFKPNITEEIYVQNHLYSPLEQLPNLSSEQFPNLATKKQKCYYPNCGKTVLQKNFCAHLKTHENHRQRHTCTVSGCRKSYLHKKDLRRHIELKHH